VNIAQLSVEDFESRLSGRTVKDIYKMARGYDVELPSGIEDRKVLIQTLHAACAAKASGGSASGVDPSAPSSDTPPDAGPQISVLCIVGGKRWRAGHLFTNEWKNIALGSLTPSQLDQIRADNGVGLRVKGLPPVAGA